jgi:hypothetical protein
VVDQHRMSPQMLQFGSFFRTVDMTMLMWIPSVERRYCSFRFIRAYGISVEETAAFHFILVEHRPLAGFHMPCVSQHQVSC